MSDSDVGKAVPPAGIFILNDRGMTLWQAVFDAITVEPLPGGMRSLKLTVGGAPIYERVLTAAEAAHLAQLLAG